MEMGKLYILYHKQLELPLDSNMYYSARKCQIYSH